MNWVFLRENELAQNHLSSFLADGSRLGTWCLGVGRLCFGFCSSSFLPVTDLANMDWNYPVLRTTANFGISIFHNIGQSYVCFVLLSVFVQEVLILFRVVA